MSCMTGPARAGETQSRPPLHVFVEQQSADVRLICSSEGGKHGGLQMTVRYASDGQVEPSGLYYAVREPRLRLLAVIDELPREDKDGDPIPALAVAEEVLEYLGQLECELDSWVKTKWPDVQILPGVYDQARKHCLSQEPRLKKYAVDQYTLLNMWVTVALMDALVFLPDLEPCIRRFHELVEPGVPDVFADPEASQGAKKDPNAGQGTRISTTEKAVVATKESNARSGQKQSRRAK